MSRVLLFVVGVLLLCVTALGALWLAGQTLVVLGALLTGAAGVLLRLMLFLALAALVGGASYFVANAWRPGVALAPAGVPSAARSRSSRWPRRRRGAAAQTPVAQSPVAQVAAAQTPFPATSPQPTPEPPTSLIVSAQPQVTTTPPEPQTEVQAGTEQAQEDESRPAPPQA